MSAIKYCLPIRNVAGSDLADILRSNATAYQYFEIWLDTISELKSDKIIDVISGYRDRVILVPRAVYGRDNNYSDLKKDPILQFAASEGVLVDFDMTVDCQKIDSFAGQRKLLSYHNYQQTPSEKELLAVIEKMRSYSPEIYKLATYCNSSLDALNLLQLRLTLNNQIDKSIV
ncbi:MAG: type I 3-dehydroquinate dehydratase, partial [Candidatus Dadabacteria bacterium]